MGLIFHSGSAKAVAEAHGSGYGYGSGSGGYGSCDGSGYGYGSGYGDGSGDGDKEYLNAILDSAVGADRAAALRGSGATLAFWRSNKDGKPCNSGSGPARHVGMIEKEQGTTPCEPGMLHATMKPEKWKGERLWAVALWNAVAVDEAKYAATKREILAEIPNFFDESQ